MYCAEDPYGCEALLRYVQRPPIAQERLRQLPDGLVRITLKRAYADGTLAVDMDLLSLLCRLAASVFAIDVLTCSRCHGRMRLLAMVNDLASVARYLAATKEATEVPRPPRGPPYWKSVVLRRRAVGDADGLGGGDGAS